MVQESGRTLLFDFRCFFSYCAASGVVTCASRGGGCPQGQGAIVIDHRNGYFTVYLHLSDINVGKGDYVEEGTVIGISGDKGAKDNPHLHFEVRLNLDGRLVPVDPYGWAGEGADPYPNAVNVFLWK